MDRLALKNLFFKKYGILKKGITIDDIKKAVAEKFDIPPNQMGGKTRKRNISTPRHIAICIASAITKESFKAIGAAFGGRNHSTVINSCEVTLDLTETETDLKKKLDEIIASLNAV